MTVSGGFGVGKGWLELFSIVCVCVCVCMVRQGKARQGKVKQDKLARQQNLTCSLSM